MNEFSYNKILKFIGLIAAAVVIFVGVMILLVGVLQTSLKNSSQTTAIPTVPPASKDNTTVLVSKVGFLPKTLTVDKGATINFANFSGETINVSSDDHPTHQKFPPLNIGPIIQGEASRDVLFSKSGIYTYHNHLKPEMKGTVVVK